ncbi:MAG TPA: class I SAM-dependent methyltransferase [Thermoanaerobaculaceae bacterium]|nr:class I SAM-dependent methyltransferase [Thermoanaerobaculaceae bacterium]
MADRHREPDYGNWVSLRLIALNAAAASLFLGLALLWAGFLAGVALFLLACGYFVYARRRFSPRGGDLEGRIRRLVVERVEWSGEGDALDVGCGNGALVIAFAHRFPRAHVTGIDFWGGLWEYSQRVCESNARIEGVAARVDFRRASAARLPFPDGTFDVVVSNLVFHEVRDVTDKTLAIAEALRVLRPGGCFVFQDLFKLKRLYGPVEDLVARVRALGVARVEFADTGTSPFIPAALRLPFMVGALGIIHGVK